MKKVLILLVLMSFLSAQDVGKYQVSTTTATSSKGKVYIVETIVDTQTGDIVKRKKILLSRYKLPYKDRYHKTVTKEKLEK